MLCMGAVIIVSRDNLIASMGFDATNGMWRELVL